MPATDKQLTAVLEYCLGFAREMLNAAGEFYPFGAEVDRSGEVRALGFWDGDEHPRPQELYSLGQDALTKRASQGEILAAALAVDVNIPEQFEAEYRDGIRVHVESEGYSRLIYAPYAISKTGLLGRKRSVSLGEMFAVEIPPLMFPARS